MNEHFQNLSDVELEQVAGGVSISLTLDKSGVSLAGPLGTLSIPNPLTLIGKVASGIFGAAGDLLSKGGGALSSVGQLFNFS